MVKVIGVGGIFFICKAIETSCNWYSRVLGVSITDYGRFDFRTGYPKQHFPKCTDGLVTLQK